MSTPPNPDPSPREVQRERIAQTIYETRFVGLPLGYGEFQWPNVWPGFKSGPQSAAEYRALAEQLMTELERPRRIDTIADFERALAQATPEFQAELRAHQSRVARTGTRRHSRKRRRSRA